VARTSSCWCGSDTSLAYSSDYSRCADCGSLFSLNPLGEEELRVTNDADSFYGKQYWLEHMTEELGFSDIFQRAQSDLTERCLHWLETLLRYRLPPARTLELGCAHGGFVFLLKTLGFDSLGLEMSPWVTQKAGDFFDIAVLLGPLEEHSEIPDASLDLIFMMDVLEHLHDPETSLATCRRVLKEDGLIFIQTPEAILKESHQEMLIERPLFVGQLKADEHLHLFTRNSLRECLRRTGFPHLQFEPAIFHFYDMFVVASPSTLPAPIESEAIHDFLTETPQRRLVKALLDMRSRELQEVDKLHKECGQAKNLYFHLDREHQELQTTASAVQTSLEACEADLNLIQRSRAYRLAQKLAPLLKPFWQEPNHLDRAGRDP
jgi:SAM-dependent methyltransferase